MSYLKLDNIKESDFQNVQEFLTQLGFSFQTEQTIHEQFMDKYKLKLKITKK
jgi:thiaminase